MTIIDLSKLANLSIVINQLKSVINTAGHNRFTRDTFNKLRRKVTVLDERFVQGILDIPESMLEIINVQDSISQAKAEHSPLAISDFEKAKVNVQLSGDGQTVMIEPAPESVPAPAPAPAPALEAKKPGKVKRKSV